MCGSETWHICSMNAECECEDCGCIFQPANQGSTRIMRMPAWFDEMLRDNDELGCQLDPHYRGEHDSTRPCLSGFCIPPCNPVPKGIICRKQVYAHWLCRNKPNESHARPYHEWI